MNCVDCKDFTCPHRSGSTGGGRCYYESVAQTEKLLTVTAEASLHYVDWLTFRREAAKDILCALVGNKDYLKVIGRIEPETMLAVRFADELIKQLKQQ